MADDFGTTTSYSDPFYDRLEAFANVIKRAWPLVLLATLLSIAGVFAISWALHRHPDAGSAARFISARDEQDATKRTAAYQALIADTSVTATFRARAGIEIVNDLLANGDTASAAPVAVKASADAAASGDVDAQLAAKLTVAAVHHQAGELDQAVTAYSEAKRVAGAKYPTAQLTASLGLAQAYIAQNKRDEAVAELELLIARSDAGAEQLLSVAKSMYWDLKRTLAEAEAAAAPTTGAAPATNSVPAVAAPAVAAPAVDAVAAIAAPAVDATVVAAPAVPAAPAPTVLPAK